MIFGRSRPRSFNAKDGPCPDTRNWRNCWKKSHSAAANFTLASGKTSTYYIDGKLTSMSAQGAMVIAEAILEEIRDFRWTRSAGWTWA